MTSSRDSNDSTTDGWTNSLLWITATLHEQHHTRMHMLGIHVCVFLCVHVCVYVCYCTQQQTWMHIVGMYVCVCVCVCVCLCVYMETLTKSWWVEPNTASHGENVCVCVYVCVQIWMTKYHELFMSSAKHGFTWWEFDWVYVGLRALGSLGIVWDIKVSDTHTQMHTHKNAHAHTYVHVYTHKYSIGSTCAAAPRAPSGLFGILRSVTHTHAHVKQKHTHTHAHIYVYTHTHST